MTRLTGSFSMSSFLPATRLSTSRSVKMPTRRPPSTTRALPCRRFCMRPITLATGSSGATVSASGGSSSRRGVSMIVQLMGLPRRGRTSIERMSWPQCSQASTPSMLSCPQSGQVMVSLPRNEGVEGAVVEDVAVLVDLDEGGPLVPGRALERLGEVLRVGVDRAGDEGALGGEGNAQRVNRLLRGAEGARLRLLAELAGRRVLPLRQAVDPVVEQQDLDVEVAAHGVDQVVAADAQAVAV